jgi:NitT/TauT family transport system ATP-binding protein
VSVLIRLVDVVKVFETGKRRLVALDGITMDVRDGEFVSLVGPSGCGNRLLPWQVIETNVGLGPEFRKRPEEERQGVVQRLLRKVRLEGFEQFLPSQLSGGMKQKAGIARALANDPEILLMDEPFAHLDALNRRMMQLELLALWEQTHKTVLYVTHSIEEAVLMSDRVAVRSASPGTILDFVEVDLPRPRTMEMMMLPSYAAMTRRIWELLEREVRRARPRRVEGE